VDRYQYPLDH